MGFSGWHSSKFSKFVWKFQHNFVRQAWPGYRCKFSSVTYRNTVHLYLTNSLLFCRKCTLKNSSPLLLFRNAINLVILVGENYSYTRTRMYTRVNSTFRLGIMKIEQHKTQESSPTFPHIHKKITRQKRKHNKEQTGRLLAKRRKIHI